MAWAVIVGVSAPESKKITATMSLVGQCDEDYAPIKDSLGNIVPVTTVEDGIAAMGTATIHQMRTAEGLNYINTIGEIKDINPDLLNKRSEYEQNLAKVVELDSLLNQPKLKKADRTKYEKELETAKGNIKVYEDSKIDERIKDEEDWQKRIDGIRGSDFDEESTLVIEYMEHLLAGYEATLETQQKELKERAAEFEANKKIFDDACKVLEVAVKTKPIDPNDEESDKVEDYVATVASYNEQVQLFQDQVKAEKSRAKKDRKLNQETIDTRNAAIKSVSEDVLASVTRYGELTVGIADNEFKIATTKNNIDTVEKAVVAAKEEGDHLMALAKAINFNILWVYFLMVFAVVFVVAGFVLNLINDPNWIKLGAVVVVVACVAGVAYAIANGHDWGKNVLPVLDANGNPTNIAFGLGSLDSPDRVIFGKRDYMLADVSIWVTYIAFVLALVAAVFSWIWSWINTIIKK